MTQKKVNGSREASEEALVRSQTRDFPGGPMVANPPPKAGDTGLTPGLGAKLPHAVGQVHLCATTRESLMPHTHTKNKQKRRSELGVRKGEDLCIFSSENLLDLETDTTWRKEGREGGVRGFAGRFQPVSRRIRDR